jgi:hypothetical protein
VNNAVLYSPPTVWTPPDWVPPRPDVPTLEFDRNEPAVIQTADWTCSCAALAWVMNALGVEAPDGGKWDEWVGVEELRRVAGANAVSPSYGLAYASGVDLEAVYYDYGFKVTRVAYPDWATTSYVLERTIGQMGGARWYHWTGVRGTDGENFNLANPAPSWKGVGQQMDSYEWDTWGGWNLVAITGEQEGRR